MKKHFFTILSGLLFILALALLYLEKHYRVPNNFIIVNNLECSEYAAFSSSFYFIKNELNSKESNTLIFPPSCDAIRIIMNPGSKEKFLKCHEEDFSRKIIQSFFVDSGTKRSKKESVVFDNFVGYKFGALHQYKVAVSVIIFLIFISSILHKTKNL